MSRSSYYEQMKALALQIRAQYGLTSPRVLRSDLRTIYKDQGIKIDLWRFAFKDLRGAYFDDEHGPTVVLPRNLPDDPAIFTLGHELKHHLVDRTLGIACCAISNQTEMVEIGAEVFAAELIFPEQDFIAHLQRMGVASASCDAEMLVRLKHDTRTTLSYAGLAKRAEFLRYAAHGSLAGIKWKSLEEKLYGEPIYKRIRRRRLSA